MKQIHLPTIIMFLSIIALFQGCSNSDNSNDEKSTYLSEIETIRKRKDLEFKNQKDSPIPAHEKEGFTGLDYFEVNESWKIKAKVVLNDQTPPIEMPHTDGQIGHMMNVADLIFERDGMEFKLHTYINSDKPSNSAVFIPFYDDSNGNSTYAGGRYLDLALTPSQDSVWLDFNLAYNPYCVYNDLYACPIPPESNYLEVYIEAGEQLPY